MSNNAKLDENSRPSIICASSNDGVTIVQIQASPTLHAIEILDGSTGSDNGNNSGNAMLDENFIPVWLAESSANNGNLVEVYGDSATNSILVKST